MVIGISITLTIAIDTIASIAIARNRMVIGIDTGSTLQSNTIAMDKLGLSISLSLTIDTHTIASIAIARNRMVVSIHTGITLQSNTIAMDKLGLSTSTASNHHNRDKDQVVHNRAV